MYELAEEEDAEASSAVQVAVAAVGGNLRLLAGMLWANRPWRVAIRLYRSLVAAIAAVAFALVTADIWRIANGLGSVRLAFISLMSVTLTAVALVGAHGLWERSPDPRVREQVALFNVVTALTILFGVLSLYVALFALTLTAAVLLLPPALLAEALRGEAGASEYLRLAWLVSSLATVGGALGSSLETDDAVREAAYSPVRRPGRARAPIRRRRTAPYLTALESAVGPASQSGGHRVAEQA